MIFVQDFNKGKELAMSEVFMGRHNGAYAQLRGHNNLPTGVASTDGNIWKHLRRFSLATLKAILFQHCLLHYFNVLIMLPCYSCGVVKDV